MKLRRQMVVDTWRNGKSKKAVVVRRERGVSLVADAMAPVAFHDRGDSEMCISTVNTKRKPGRALFISRAQENLVFRWNRGDWWLRLVRKVAKLQGAVQLLSRVVSRSHYKRIRLISRHDNIG